MTTACSDFNRGPSAGPSKPARDPLGDRPTYPSDEGLQ